MKDPAFLFYSQDFLVGTMTMSYADRGKYITILSLMHQQGRMNEKSIVSLVGSISDILASKFKIDDQGFWYNVRLEKAIDERAKYTGHCRENGSKGGRPRKEEKPKGNPEETNGFLKQEPKRNPEETISFSSSIITISNDIVKPKKDYKFLDSIIKQFSDSYESTHGSPYEIVAIGKERQAISKLLSEFKKKHKDASSESTVKELRKYFDSCNRISDTWLQQNMSPSIIMSKFNEINNILRNGNKQPKGQPATSSTELTRIFAKNFATDSAGK